ncbi:hypothetical protein BH24GEM3_BH24GEM3_26380 [soil metagenome]
MTMILVDSWIYRPDSQPLPSAAELGGKASNLLRLRELEVEVPAWIAIRAEAFDRLVLRERPWPRTPEEAVALQEEMRTLDLPEEFRGELSEALEEAGLRGKLLAVRSSAAQEDGASASFAGQFDSVLGVRVGEDGAALWDAVRQVWASAFSARAAIYSQQHLDAQEQEGVRMAVILQEMVDAAVSGVAFSADPVSGSREVAVVSAVYGLGEGLVGGDLNADSYRIAFTGDAPGSVQREIVWKEHAYRLLPEGGTALEGVPVPLWDLPALTDEEATRIADAARRLADALGAPQDLEWALEAVGPAGPLPRPLPRTRGRGEFSGARSVAPQHVVPTLSPELGGEVASLSEPERRRSSGASPSFGEYHPPRRLLILQARPITTLSPEARPNAAPMPRAEGGERRIWDNSNIIESYSGVTTPLTFSFARGVYEDVYLQFCRLMGVSEKLLTEHRHVFAGMLGLIHGRVYYNLLNWYRVLALLPGYSVNREFMERMMGVREKLADPPRTPPVAGRWEDTRRLARMAGRLLREQRRLRHEVPAFHARVQAALAPVAGKDLGSWPAEELVALYRRLEGSLLRHWRAPLVNDFFAMIFFGLLVRLIEKWLPDTPPTLANDLLCGEGRIISTEPARRVMELARRVKEDPVLADLFASETDDAALWRRLAAEPEFRFFHRKLDAYLKRFGDRCMEELKLETVTLAEDPSFLLQMIRAYAAQEIPGAESAPVREAEIRRAAEATVRGHLGGVRRRLFQLVLQQARQRVRDRENLRFERTRVFAVVRRIFLGLGGHLAARGQLDSPRDVFYLTVEEVFAHFSGTGATSDLRPLVALRHAEFEEYTRMPAPPDRFETLGPPAEIPEPPEPTAAAEGDLKGMGCCPGLVRAPVRIVRDPRQAGDLAGHILVAERTDPGWTLLFPAIRGLLVQRGSLLSHSAIVAREMGIPCIVAVPQLLDTLHDGEVVEMDGATGVIRRAPPSSGPAGPHPPAPSPKEGEGEHCRSRRSIDAEVRHETVPPLPSWERGLGGEGR